MREDILRLHLGIAAIVWEARALADRHTALEVAGGEGGAEDEIAGANGVRRPFGLDRVCAFGIVEDLPFEARVVRERNRIDIQPRAVEGECIANFNGGAAGGLDGKYSFQTSLNS